MSGLLLQRSTLVYLPVVGITRSMQLHTLAQRCLERPGEQTLLIVPTLIRFGRAALQTVHDAGIRIYALEPGEQYIQASRVLKSLNVTLDTWDPPPAGLFVVAERRIYLRSFGPMAVAHEFGHAIDCALGQGRYHSEQSLLIRHAFQHARAWVSPYAATRLDEYFAEAIRAYVGANDLLSPWPRVTRAYLQERDPIMFRYLDHLFTTKGSTLSIPT